jgi:hypothetical protein
MDTGNTGVAVSWEPKGHDRDTQVLMLQQFGEYFPGHLQAFDGLLARRWAIQIPRVTKELKATDDWVEVRIEF